MNLSNKHPTASYFPQRLLAQLQAALSSPISVAEAPAGYGKTTALKRLEEMCEGQAQCHWFIALHEDADRAWDRLCQTLAEFDRQTGERLLALGLPNRLNARQAGQMLEDLRCETETMLMLDNFQSLPKELRNLLVTSLFRVHCPRLHIIISTQYLPLPRYAEQGVYGVNRIGTSELALNANDIRAYYAMEGKPLTPGEAEFLLRRTEGWPVAVSLCLRGEVQVPALREDYRVDSLLADAYFDGLTQLEQERLLPFALFDAVSQPQLTSIAGIPLSPDYRELIRRTPLLRYDAASGTYYPHAILRDFLTMRLAAAAEDVRRGIYVAAGQWHARQGNLCQAIACFHAVKAYDQILSLPLVNLCYAKIGKVAFETVAREILSACPPAMLSEHPISLLRIAYYLFAAADYTGYTLAMEKARLAVESSGDSTLLGEYLVMDALSVYPDAKKMGERWTRAQEMLGGNCRVIDPREPFLFGCMSMWYMFYTMPGAGERIGQELETALSHYNALTNGHAGGADVLYWAELACIRGNYEDSQMLAYQAAQLSEDASQPTTSYGAALLLGRIAISRTDMAGLENAIDYMENKAAAYPFMRGSAMNAYMLDTARGMMRSMMEQTRQAPAWARQGARREENLGIATFMTRHAYISDVMLDKQYDRAIGIMEATLRLDRRLCNLVTEYYLYVGMALSNLGLLRRGKAVEALEKALAIGAPDGLVSIFVHHRKLLSILFANMELQRKYGAFIAQVMSTKGSFTGASFSDLASLSQQSMPDSLTERERKIAQLAAQGMRNREIARQEFISEYTVRNHLKKIFSKLDIDRRSKLSDLLKP